jgi:pimeloyl-ACP methyl ester carboxylesterase
MTSNRPTLVLVPGAWHRPSTYDLLRGELDILGYATRAVKLPTAGPDPHGSLYDDAAAIREAVGSLSGPVVVVAHSYGGIPAAEGTPDGVQRLIHLSAYVPDVGESMYTLHGMPDPESADGLFPTSADPRAQLYSDLPEEDGNLAVSRLVDQLHRPFADRVTRAAWHTVPSSYVVTERDNSMPVELQEEMAARTSDVRRIATGHSPFLSRPAELAALIDRIITG